MLTPNFMQFKVFPFSCLLFLVFLGAAKATDEGQALRLSNEAILWSIKGQVQVLKPGYEGYIRTTVPAEKLSDGALIATGDAPSFAGVVLPDRSLLKIAPNSVVQISSNDHKVFLKSGAIVFSQAKKSISSMHYTLITSKNMIIPRGNLRLSAGAQKDECLNLDKSHSKVISLLPDNQM